MNEAEYLTPDWFNGIAERALKRIMDVAEPVIRQYVHDGVIGGFAPLSLDALKRMPIQQAVTMVQNMMNIPTTRAAGVALFAKYLTYLETSGQLAPGAAKLLTSQAARGQAAGELV